MHRSTRRGILTGMVAAALLVPLTNAAPAAARSNDTPEELTRAVTLPGVLRHLLEFQKHADRNGGNRFSGLPGHTASVEYAQRVFERAGYDTTLQEFEYLASTVVGPSALEQISPNAVTYVEDVDFGVLAQTDDGDVTAAVTPVDIQLGLGNASTSGCEAADFAGFPAGNIALLQRGVCTFELKAENAAAAGAVGAILFNQGNTAAVDRNNIPAVTLGAGNTSGIPALGATYALGAELTGLAQSGDLVMRVFANVIRDTFTTWNVLAESPGGDPNNVVMAGAHLDSVGAGPGFNDNGSGSAAILEVARQLGDTETTNKVRFALWGAEESGLVGSTFYVANLPQAERDKIALYLNFDMIGSPNYSLGIYDGDNSDAEGAGPGPAGSAEIEDVFEAFFAARGVPTKGTDFTGRSDYGPFIAPGVDIPAGGLFTGAEQPKTADDVAKWGGVEGEQYDPCYHQACDSLFPTRANADRDLYRQLRLDNRLIGNISADALDINSDAVADAVITFAMDTSMLP